MAQATEVSSVTRPGVTEPWIAYWNGRFVPDSEITVSPWDRGFIMADAAFEATRTFRHTPFHLDWHLDRFFNSLQYLRLDPRLTRQDVERLTLEVLERNRGALRPEDDAVLTHRVTRGEFTGGFSSTEGPPTILIWCRPVAFSRYAHYYREGLVVEIPGIRVPRDGGIDPRIKTQNRLLMTLGHVEVGHLRPDVVPLLLDTAGYVTESSAANIHYVLDGTLVTPPDHVALEGITRRVLLTVAERANIPVVRRPLHRQELASVQEAMVTATSFCVLPVRTLDGRALSPIPGPLTARLTEAFSAYAGVDIVEQARMHAER